MNDEVKHDYEVDGNPSAVSNLFGETAQELENRRILQEAERTANAKAYMNRKDEDITPTEKMLRDAQASELKMKAEAEADHMAYQLHVEQQNLAKATQLQNGSPMNEDAWNEIQKSDFKFYLSKAGTAIRMQHKKTLGLMFFSNH